MTAYEYPLSISADVDGEGDNSIYHKIRHEILAGDLTANERLKVSELAKKYGVSTNPVREALQQLRGEGLVIFVPNQGARIRAIDTDFVRDVSEVGQQLEPYLVRFFVETASQEDIDQLEAIQDEMEALNFSDKNKHADLDCQFHSTLYGNHYNRVAYKLWQQHRQILWAISTRVPVAIGRREAIFQEHRKLIECIKRQDADATSQTLYQHVRDAGRHLVDRLSIAQRNQKT
ncbi:GntR family transcriptional regulator [Halocynthiibacter sp. C4]|uniref:GntR family transcriptional regulator n=1 Tax=Halocynthiibacter sp. C4 TaxID=2992758 RepID=UPI00237A2D23|nr:GntR family transcriptional regulator [Halocynthiibacter sp. C4]MDE0589081.1 GntR family transcriptional regulator [Halocynthiibacter sp. C4]